MASTPRWIPLLFGSVLILMAVLILGALTGFIPTEGGRFLAPPVVIISLGLCLFFGGLAMWIPQKAPALIRGGIFCIALASLALVCNWTAFAPEVTYSSSTSIGPVQISGKDQVGGRMVFGIAALFVDIFILSAIIGWVRSRHRSESKKR